MSNALIPKIDPDAPPVYQIRLKGHLDLQWTDWFGGLTIILEDNGDTLLTGPVVDQAALFGLLKKVRNLGMSLVSVNCIEPGPEYSLTNPSTTLATGRSKGAEANETHACSKKRRQKK